MRKHNEEREIFETFAEPKSWWQSRAIWGGVVAAGAGVAGMFGVAVDEVALTELAVSAAAIAGGALAVVGRYRTTRPVRFNRGGGTQ